MRLSTRVRRLVAAIVPTRALRLVQDRRRRAIAKRIDRTGLRLCDDAIAWAETNDQGPVRQVLDASSKRRRLPRTIEAEILPIYYERIEVTQRPRYLAELRGARIVGRAGIVMLPDDQIATQSIFGNAVIKAEPEFTRIAQRPRVAKPGRYFSLLVLYARKAVYYHWMHDTLEQLFGVIDVLPADTKLVVPAGLRPYQTESLRAIGITEDRLARFDAEEVWEPEVLYFAPPAVNSGANRADADEWLRSRILETYSITPASTGRRLYLSRRAQTRRRVRNEPEVEQLLRRYGFETVLPEKLTLGEQVALFASCEAVVSTHGSAFTNILFSPVGLKVLDMIEPGMTDLAFVFWSLAESLGHEYWYFITDMVERPGPRANDPVIQMDKLEASLDAMGLDRRA